jgi:hypothetical protein
MTRSHKWTDRDHAGIADGSAERESRLPRYFAKSGHADTDPTKTKKDGSGKGNWGRDGDEVEDMPYNMNNARRRSNSSTNQLKDFKTKFERGAAVLNGFKPGNGHAVSTATGPAWFPSGILGLQAGKGMDGKCGAGHRPGQ